MILFTICVVAVLVGLFFYLRDMGMLGGPNRDPIRGGVVPEIPSYTYKETHAMNVELMKNREGSNTWQEVQHMRDMQQGVSFNVAYGTQSEPYFADDDEVDDCGPDCE
jgi:hypothetical protein